MIFSDEILSNIPHVISEPRFATYLRYCGNDRAKALQLYQWNLQVSSSLIIPLHILEVSIRNAVVEALEEVHTSNWPWNQGFMISLPSRGSGYSPRKNLAEVARRQPTMGKVVAELNFIFWEKMFTSSHDSRIWNNYIKAILPYSPETMTVREIRACMHDNIRDIRELRNRIAHHEPIFLRNIQKDYDTIRQLVFWRNKVTSNWMDSLQTVTKLIEEKPSSQ